MGYSKGKRSGGRSSKGGPGSRPDLMRDTGTGSTAFSKRVGLFDGSTGKDIGPLNLDATKLEEEERRKKLESEKIKETPSLAGELAPDRAVPKPEEDADERDDEGDKGLDERRRRGERRTPSRSRPRSSERRSSSRAGADQDSEDKGEEGPA